MPPDVTVVVGTGDNQQEFECYKVVLSFASPYLDAMLSNDMVENNNSRIEFPDKDPDEWKIVYGYMIAHDTDIVKENAQMRMLHILCIRYALCFLMSNPIPLLSSYNV
jgi:hypothetical protein